MKPGDIVKVTTWVPKPGAMRYMKGTVTIISGPHGSEDRQVAEYGIPYTNYYVVKTHDGNRVYIAENVLESTVGSWDEIENITNGWRPKCRSTNK